MHFAPTWIARLLEQHIRRIVAKHYILLSVLSLALTALAVFTIVTKLNINSDFKALLPETSEAVKALNEVDTRIGGGSSLFVVVDSPDRQKNIEFAKTFSAALYKMDGVALAHYHNDKTFFEAHQLLYMDVEDLRSIHDRVKKRIRQAKKEANPFFVSLGPSKKSAPLTTSDLEQKYAQRGEHQRYNEYLVSDDGFALVILVRFVESSTNMVATNNLITQVRELGQSLDPASFHPKMKIELGGALANRQKQYNSILGDIRLSAIFTILGVLLFIAAYFGRFRAVALLLSPLIMSVLWTLALAFLIFGELTIITVFIFAILLGLGIDFGIHLLSGYDHARLDGHEPVEALVQCYQGTGLATVLGATTTFCTFAVLSFAQFKGLSQFGVVASIGVLGTLLAMLVSLPSMLLTFHRILPHSPSTRRKTTRNTLLTPKRFNRLVKGALPVALALIVASTVGALTQVGDVFFEEDFYEISEITWPWQRKNLTQRKENSRIRNLARINARHITFNAEKARQSMSPETYKASRYQKSVGQKYTSALQGRFTSAPSILLFDSSQKTKETFQRMEKARKDGDINTWKVLNSIYSFMPGTMEEQEAKMVEIKRIKALLDNEPRSFLKRSERDKLDKLRKKTQVSPLTIYDMPLWTKMLFKESGSRAKPAAEGEDFAFEYVIYVTERFMLLNGPKARQYLKDIDTVADPQKGEFRVGSQAYVYIAMLDEVQKDGPRMMLVALFIVFLILTLGFKHPARALMAMVPLGFGAIWTAGFIGWAGIKMDFFNVIIIPALIGIGIDDGIHFYIRYLELGRGSLARVMRQVGSAIIMTSITSMIGFGGLAITNYDGLKSIGYLAIVGICAALFATLLIMPTIIWIAERFDLPWVVAPEVKDDA